MSKVKEKISPAVILAFIALSCCSVGEEGTLDGGSEYPTMLVSGGFHNCILENGSVRCWGWNVDGQLGRGDVDNVGDDETLDDLLSIDLGGLVVSLDSGGNHNCALLDTGDLSCWGRNGFGQLGYGNEEFVGDDEMPISVGYVSTGEEVVKTPVLGEGNSCVLTGTGGVKCWGVGYGGSNGTGYTTNHIGDNELPSSFPLIDLGATAVQMCFGNGQGCVVSDQGRVRCWGNNYWGNLGYGNLEDIGDDETPASAGDIPLDGDVGKVFCGSDHTCALMEDGGVRCWGTNENGALGYGVGMYVGDDETLESLLDVSIGGVVVELALGSGHSCAILDTGDVKCWGNNEYGQLGYGNTNTVGLGNLPSDVGIVDLGGKAVQISTGYYHTCALLDTGRVRCWGRNDNGQLGYGHTENIGDDETPASAGDVPGIQVDPESL